MRKGTKHKENYRGTPLERFMRFVEKTDSCWIWKGAKNKKGYGWIRFNNGGFRAHRLSYLLYKGDIPKDNTYHGVCVLHKCDNPSCVNPEHLFLGSNSDNVKDMVVKMRNTIGERNGCAKLTSKDVLNIRKLNKERISGRDLANKYNISETTVSQIIHKTRWKHI